MDILTSKSQLKYPLYACDFDAQDGGRLVVGGGGGSSRTGVGNRITVLDASANDASLTAVAEIELSKNEDNVTSLAAGPRHGQTTLVFAGVNSSPEDQKKGKNEHFRVFGVDAEDVDDAANERPATISERAQAAFFAPPPSAASTGVVDDTYQRLIRLSAPFANGQGGTLPQLGACATGLARAGASQIALFDVLPTDTAVLPVVRGRIEELPKEANDLDVIQTAADRYQLAFCSDHALYLHDIAPTSGSEEPILAYTLTLDVANGATERPVFRAIRYVTPHFLLAALNMPRRTGVRLMGLRLPTNLPTTSPVAGSDGKAPANLARTTTVHITVPRSVLTQATALAVRGLAQPAAPGVPLGNAQFVVAVAGAPDNTIALYTLEHQTVGTIEALAKLYPFRTLRRVHEMQMTSIALAPFVAPPATAPAYIRLASVSVGNSVVVHHIPLRRLPVTASTTADAPRYVVALPSRGPSGLSLYLFAAITMVLIAIVSQGLLEVRGLTPSVLGARQVVPVSWLQPEKVGAVQPIETVEAVAAEAVSDAPSPIFDNDGISVAALLRGDVPAAPAVLFLRGEDADHTVVAALHDEAEHGPASSWEALSAEQQDAWQQRLQAAGYWSEDMGVAVFRGIVFSQIGGAIGGLVR